MKTERYASLRAIASRAAQSRHVVVARETSTFDTEASVFEKPHNKRQARDSATSGVDGSAARSAYAKTRMRVCTKRRAAAESSVVIAVVRESLRDGCFERRRQCAM